jgi:hypothetical protein
MYIRFSPAEKAVDRVVTDHLFYSAREKWRVERWEKNQIFALNPLR